MEINFLYLPSFSGHPYLGLDKSVNNIQYTAIVDTLGLINQMAMRVGIHYQAPECNELEIEYSKAVKEYMKNNPDNILKASYDIDNLSTVQTCFSWRNKLVMAGWNRKDAPTSRMKVLADIEKGFKPTFWNLENAIADFIQKLKDNNTIIPNADDITVTHLFNLDLYHPAVKVLLKRLEDKGVKIRHDNHVQTEATCLRRLYRILNNEEKIQVIDGKLQPVTLEPDDSFSYTEFNDYQELVRALVTYYNGSNSENEVWINANPQDIDNWLGHTEMPTMGSQITHGTPHVSQMLATGLQLFAQPLDLNVLIEWLYYPLHPLKGLNRSQLISKIVDNGSFLNEKCSDLANAYRSEKRGNEHLADTFLPNVQSVDLDTITNDNEVDKDKLKNFLVELEKWGKKQLNMDTASNEYDFRIPQLGKVIKDVKRIINLLSCIDDETPLMYSQVATWINLISESEPFTNYPAMVGANYLIPTPDLLLANAPSVLWTDCYNYVEPTLTYSFLLPTEKAVFLKLPYYWKEDCERELLYQQTLLPFRFAKKLRLVSCKSNGSVPFTKHPLIIRLEQSIKNFTDFKQNLDVNIPVTAVGECELVPSNRLGGPIIDNDGSIQEIPQFYDLDEDLVIEWPETESASSLNTLINYPLDYAFHFLGKLRDKGMNALPGLNQLKGNVAHKIFEDIFKEYENEEIDEDKAQKISDYLKENYDRMFNETVNDIAASFLLPENIINSKIFKVQFLNCFNAFLDILKLNKLTIVGSEKKTEEAEHAVLIQPDTTFSIRQIEENAETEVGLIKIDKGLKQSAMGSIDILLRDSDNRYLIIDYKWTTQPESKKKLIKENNSIQLAVYADYVRKHYGEVRGVGYLVMPKGILVSNTNLISNYVDVVQNTIDINLIKEHVVASYVYRRFQFEKLHKIEEAEGIRDDGNLYIYSKDKNTYRVIRMPLDAEAGEILPEGSLLPPLLESKLKAVNPFSNYKSFKNNRQKKED